MQTFKIDVINNNISAFNGLTEKELLQLYNTASVMKLKQFETLVKENVVDNTIYILLSGSVKLFTTYNDQNIEIIISQKNSFIDSPFFNKSLKKAFSAVTLEPSSIMAINEKTFELLFPQIKTGILKNLSSFLAINYLSLIRRLASSTTVVTHLSSYIKDFYKAKADLCAKSELIEKLIKKIPRLPAYSLRLTELLMDDNASVQDVIEIAKTDPSLIADTLKTINSAYYNLSYKVSDFQHAVMFLGFNKIYQIAIESSLNSFMPATEEFQKLQSQSILVASLGYEIALQCTIQKPVILNTIGMLHNIGKSLILLFSKEQPFLSILFNMLDDAKIASLLLKSWNMPKRVYLPIEYQHLPEFLPPEDLDSEFKELITVLYLAKVMAISLQRNKEDILSTTFADKYLASLNIKKSMPSFTREMLLNIKKKIETFPEEIRLLLTK
ncbi:MAG: HDOD domain-containing protein [Thermodesulfovibrionales bacterium]|nr:HDOD domain-containing protein [Thermodesulfovibrionales bacterium]